MPKIYFDHNLTGDVTSQADLHTLPEFIRINFDPIQKMAFLWIDDEVIHRGNGGHGRAFIAWDESPGPDWPGDPDPLQLQYKVGKSDG